MSWKRLEDIFARSLEDDWQTSWRRLEDVLKMSRRLFCKTSWRRFEDVLAKHLEDVLKTFLQNILKTSWQDVLKTPGRRLENVLMTSWRCMTKTNILVLIKTSWRPLQDGFIKTNVCWINTLEYLPVQFYSCLLHGNSCIHVSCYLVSTNRTDFCIFKSNVLVFCRNSVFWFLSSNLWV